MEGLFIPLSGMSDISPSTGLFPYNYLWPSGHFPTSGSVPADISVLVVRFDQTFPYLQSEVYELGSYSPPKQKHIQGNDRLRKPTHTEIPAGRKIVTGEKFSATVVSVRRVGTICCIVLRAGEHVVNQLFYLIYKRIHDHLRRVVGSSQFTHTQQLLFRFIKFSSR